MPPRKKKRKFGSRSADLTTKRFAESEIKRWKKMDKTSEDFLVDVLDEGISTIKTNSKKDQYSKINEQLQECRHSLVKKWKAIKTPKNTFGTYKGLQKLNVSYSSTLSDIAQHQEDLESAVQKAEKACKAMEKELEKRQRCLEEESTDLHPLLRADIKTVLDIPTIPRFVMES
ncbi:uncharacterized protein LOC110459418 [Mizuhopecten yessoensis]|uniref:Centromere protein Q n=1 Tax=Mizuhopecten yessoensis TaxID=6573 RepID=A0A210Q4K4_MIZYE|nr:uncharacterized protein LOC110459418 [Mizuhopecten yessoensis]OWF43674.1 hypothetical protein KP79_PYT16756 [Mizuhopecten yessoensis]